MKRGTVAVGVKFLGVGSAFAANIVIARTLSLSDAGYFFLLYGFVTLASAGSRLGLDMICVREIAKQAIKGSASGVLMVKESALAVVVLTGIAVAALVVAVAPGAATLAWAREDLAGPLATTALAIPAFSALMINAMHLQGTFRPMRSILAQGVTVPLILTVLLAISGATEIAEASKILLLSVYGAFLATLLLESRRYEHGSVRIELTKDMLASGFPMLIAQFCLLGHVWFAHFVLSVTRSTAEVALFYSAERLSLLTSFGLVAVGSIIAPKFAALHATQNSHELTAVARTAYKFSVALALPVFVVSVAYPSVLLTFFGSNYTEASTALRVMSGAQLLNAVTGPATYILAMTGRERVVRNSIVSGSLVSVVLTLALAQPFGVSGAAIACAAGIAISNLLQWLYVHRNLGIRFLTMSHDTAKH